MEKKLIPIYRLNIYADDKSILNDLDLANDISDLIEQCLLKRVKPVLDFDGIFKIEPYWFVLALYKWVLRGKEQTNKIVGVVNIEGNKLKLLNIVANKIIENGKDILNGITIDKLPNDDA